MNNQFFEQPVLNSPYTYPARHWELDTQGQPTQKALPRKQDTNRTNRTSAHHAGVPDGARCPTRNNPETYLECCIKLHEIFQRVAKARADFSDKAAFMDFSKIEPVVKKIIGLQACKQDRIDAWKNAARKGKLFGTGKEKIPEYDENNWHNNRENLKREKDSRVAPKLPVFRFYQAAAVHRINVIRHILPEKELVVA